MYTPHQEWWGVFWSRMEIVLPMSYGIAKPEGENMNGKCGNHRVARVWVECFVKGCKIRGEHVHCEDRNCLSYRGVK